MKTKKNPLISEFGFVESILKPIDRFKEYL